MSEVNDVNCAEPGGEGKSGRKSGLGGKRATIWGKTTPRPVAADTDAADGPHGLGMQCHCTGVMPTGRACSDRPGFAKFARVTEMLVVPDENCGVVPRMSGASGSPVTPTFLAGSIN